MWLKNNFSGDNMSDDYKISSDNDFKYKDHFMEDLNDLRAAVKLKKITDKRKFEGK